MHEALTPSNCALEFELVSGGGRVPSVGLWRWSQTGEWLLLVRAGEA